MSKNKIKILIANGVNLDLLGKREPDVYGGENLEDLKKEVLDFLKKMNLHDAIEIEFFQSNSEEAFLSKISESFDSALINPGAWTHTSVALADRLAAVKLEFIEVHLSHLGRREEFRKTSYTSSKAMGVVYGLGFNSYVSGLTGLLRYHKLI